jgi:hypothetical protein
MTRAHTVRSYTRRSPSQPEAYVITHRALIADARRDPAIMSAYRQRRQRAAQARLDAAMERMAAELTDALEQALRSEMETG